jgi:hypothetical protein
LGTRRRRRRAPLHGSERPRAWLARRLEIGDLVSLPLVLAGPILRRVEPNLVSVWMALSRPASVTVTLWDGRTKTGAADPFFRSDPATSTLRVADQLHVALALLRIPAGSEKLLKPGVVYSYDVALNDGTTTQTLASLGLLKSAPTANGGPPELARPHLALGYVDDFLPSFSLPPATLDDLRIVYGSCRRAANEHPDAMPMIDDLIVDASLYEDPLKRPHQLVLGGDQIYADDLWAGHLYMLNPLANELIGTYVDDRGKRLPLETLTIDHVPSDDPVNHPDGWAPGGTTPLQAGLMEFPAGRRRGLVVREAQMSTTDGESHLFSFGEFAAMYVMVWSNACWPVLTAWPTAQALLAPTDKPDRPVPPGVDPPLDWDRLTAEDVGKKEGKERYKDCDGLKDDELAHCNLLQRRKRLEDRHFVKVKQLADFVAGLPKVRRTLANVPTYMILDDHDATDDWNLNPIWVDRVNNASLGRTILRNALASYAIFQDWGNDPVRYLNERDDTGPLGDPKRMLETIAAMFPPRASADGPPATPEQPPKNVADALDHFFGLDLRPQPTIDGDYEAVNPPIKWHFSVPGPRHLLVALDNRTRRSYVSREGPPGNVSIPAQADQIPATLPAGCELLVVIAPLQVLGPGILDELIAPSAYRVFDAANYSKLNQPSGDKEQDLKAVGTRRMIGTDPDAIEAWAFDPLALEALLKRLAPHRRVLLLSGDVHYSAATETSYWTKGNPVPARIVQFTGSGFKNVMPWFIGAVDRVLSFAQRMVRSGIGAERMGWNAADDRAFVFKGGNTLADVPPVLRRKLHESPMLMPTFGWPDGTTVAADKLPDWSWRLKPTLDLRPDAQRPPPGRPRALDPPEERIQALLVDHAEPGRELAAYATIAARHQDQFDRLRHSRQILFRSNFALVRFERAPDLTAVHEVYTALPDPDAPADQAPKPFAYMVQRASLEGRADEVRPELAPFSPPAF